MSLFHLYDIFTHPFKSSMSKSWLRWRSVWSDLRTFLIKVDIFISLLIFWPLLQYSLAFLLMQITIKPKIFLQHSHITKGYKINGTFLIFRPTSFADFSKNLRLSANSFVKMRHLEMPLVFTLRTVKQSAARIWSTKSMILNADLIGPHY